MCLIVNKPTDQAFFSNTKFKNACSTNADGLGIMFVEDGRVNVVKSMGKAYEKLQLFKSFKSKEKFALHLRYATSGLESLDMCHPFEILNKDESGVDLWMMHNGVIYETTDYQSDASDTWHFVELYLKPMLQSDPTLIFNPNIQDMISKFIGTQNKLLFMDSNNEVVIINKKQGFDVDGCWLSNTYSVVAATTTCNYKNYDYDYKDEYDNLPFYKSKYEQETGRTSYFPGDSIREADTKEAEVLAIEDKTKVPHFADNIEWETEEDLIEAYIKHYISERTGIEMFFDEYCSFPDGYDDDLLEIYMEDYGVDEGVARFYAKFGLMPETYALSERTEEEEKYEEVEDVVSKISINPVRRKKQEDRITISNFHSYSRGELQEFIEGYPDEAATLLFDLGEDYHLIRSFSR